MDRIPVHSLSLGPDQLGSSELFCSFYPLGCLVAYAKAAHGGALELVASFIGKHLRR